MTKRATLWQGPPGVGKTTLIKSLVKHYTRHNLSNVRGPINIVSGKNRRLTIVECGNDLASMMDVGKSADLILLMIDGSFGFEMETFEFLNILQAHGFPKILGVLTHLDSFRDGKTLKKTKKRMKAVSVQAAAPCAGLAARGCLRLRRRRRLCQNQCPMRFLILELSDFEMTTKHFTLT